MRRNAARSRLLLLRKALLWLLGLAVLVPCCSVEALYRTGLSLAGELPPPPAPRELLPIHHYLWAAEGDGRVALDPIWPWTALTNVYATVERLERRRPFDTSALSAGAGAAADAARLLVFEQLARGEVRRRPGRPLRETAMTIWFSRHFTAEQLALWRGDRHFFGRQAVGVEAAARAYFDKPSASLSLAEAAYLVGLPQAPMRYDAACDQKAALRRRTYVLGRLKAAGLITQQEHDVAERSPLVALDSECPPQPASD